ncbi:MAG: hypothetical protein WBK55_10330 [Alphaproteobacteria bacterium]
MRTHGKISTTERGNVMFYILIAVALLAALIYAVAQSGRGNVQQVNVERARILASEIVDYASAVATSFSQLRLRGCTLNEMNFDNDLIGGYTNGGAPSDQTCDIFALPGGGVTFKRPPDDAVTATGIHVFSAAAELDHIGSTCAGDACADLIMFTGPLNETVCIQVNDQLGIGFAGDPPPEGEADVATLGKYTGTITHAVTFGDLPASAAFQGKSAACFQDDGDSLYYFYKVLAAR